MKNCIINAAVRADCHTYNCPVDDDAIGMYKTVESKEAYVCKEVMAALKKLMPRTGPMKKVKFLAKMITDGKVFGSEGQ